MMSRGIGLVPSSIQETVASEVSRLVPGEG